jgi:uncharacterized protein (DUF2235 family)
MQGSLVGGVMSKAIVVFSDGTGNSAAKFNKTNVWRLYEALDTEDPPRPGRRKQIAYYDDGVGTSTFRPWALLGGAFGVGLRRNVLDLYRFLCFNYEKGDQIYAFGFSRGAFTIRVLIGLVVDQGLIKCATDEDHDRHATEAYRAYRERYGRNQQGERDHIVWAFRALRGERGKARRRALDGVKKLKNEDLDIAFVGVWDTVAAYGMPIAELTRGIDKYVWPLSMPNYRLSPLVKKACHALALDDERDTFHPLLWDEVAEREYQAKRLVEPGRLEQVWFAGMHSDVGGGYPDDGLSHIPLEWMMRKAEAAGLRFSPLDVERIERGARESGPMHDSRRGFASYYRYQPRKLSARVDPPDPTTIVMRHPDQNGRGLLTSVKIHESVFRRIQAPEHDYAPIVIPGSYEVVTTSGARVPSPEQDPEGRARRQEWVWNDVWRRRVGYFTTVGLSLFIVAVAFANLMSEPSACDGALCILTPVIESIGAFLPGFLEAPVRALARSPEWVFLAGLGIFLLMRRSGVLQRRIGDGMAELWMESIRPGSSARATLAGRSTEGPRGFPYSLRTNGTYLKLLQKLKWHVVPTVFGIGLLLLMGLGGLYTAVAGVYRLYLAWAEVSNFYCTEEFADNQGDFRTSSLCWPVAPSVDEGHRYRITIEVGENWEDAGIPARPSAPQIDQMPFLVKYVGIPFRRYVTEPWFQPMIRIIPHHGTWWTHTSALTLHPVDGNERRYTGEFVAVRSGKPYIFVNDAWPARWGLAACFYRNNKGTAKVTIVRIN